MKDLIIRDVKLSPELSYAGSILRTLSDYIRHTEFKRILNRICMAQQEEGFKSLAVLSEFKGEGRTFFVSALALAFTKFLNSRVLIVDAASQTKNHSLFLRSIVGRHSADKSSRFKDIEGYVDLMTTRSIQHTPYDYADFYLSSHLKRLRDQYDLILIDTCPLSRVSENNIDPLITARHAERALVVLSKKSFNEKSLARIKGEAATFGINVLGSVYNPNAGVPFVTIQEFVNPGSLN